MTDNDKMIDYLEQQIPAMAAHAIAVAHWQALASGETVLMAQDGALWEKSPDGTMKKVKDLESGITVTPGTKFEIR